jgi:hypothetical protein
MISRPYPSRIATSCIVLAAAGVWSNVTAAAGATPPVAGWHSPNAASSQSHAGANSNAKWRLPNGQTTQRTEPASQIPVNPLRQKRPAPQQGSEPHSFQPPSNAGRIATAQQSNNEPAAAATRRRPASNPVAQTAAAVPSRRVSNTSRPATYQRPTTPGVARSSPPVRRPNPQTPIWQRINVAMQGPAAEPEETESEMENLPSPNQMSEPATDPFGPSGYYLEDDVQYDPTCGPDGCYGECGCGDACSCGGGCEPGCGCSTGNGSYRCDGECCNDCLRIGPGDPESCHSVRVRVPKWQELSVFAGVQGFKGPYDQDRDRGNFGFHEGFNMGYKIPYTFAGYQIGYQAAQSQLNGDENSETEESHTQHFATFGLFRRATDGLQFGTAWDVLRDQRFQSVDFHQLRSEVSWMDCGKHEFGFSGTVGINQNEDPDEDDRHWKASDQYVLFYRIHGDRGGEGRIYGGWNDVADGILGADMLLPVHDRWSVQTGFTYLIPDARDGEDGAREEAWNINLALVWHWDCRARKSHNNPYRPLFNVANNGYLIVDNRDDD